MDRVELIPVVRAREALELRRSVSVVVPSYRRPSELQRCLAALAAQTVTPDEVIVSCRRTDQQTAAVVSRAGERCSRLRLAWVDAPGVIEAMTAAIASTTGSIVAFTDDDAAPRPEWIGHLIDRFAVRGVGGVGGRDVVPGEDDEWRRTADVGRITRWGRMIGNHHLGKGAPRPVATLKGANMAFRVEALALPANLCGQGAQRHWEVATCLWAVRRGWTLLYDPQLLVDHYPAARFDADRRGNPEGTAVRDASYNLVTSLVSLRPDLVRRRAAYGVLLGDLGATGVLRSAAALATGDRRTAAALMPSLRGQVDALARAGRGRGVRMITAQEMRTGRADRTGDHPRP